MFIVAGVLLMVGVPAVAFCSLLAGIKLRRHNKLLAGVILIGTIASGLSFLWQMRFDIWPLREFLSRTGLFFFESPDLTRYFVVLYIGLFLASLLAPMRWRPEYGSATVLNLSLVFWLLAGLPYLLLNGASFAN
jgi:hypothetical protein